MLPFNPVLSYKLDQLKHDAETLTGLRGLLARWKLRRLERKIFGRHYK